MRYEHDAIDYQTLLRVVKSKGLTDRQFCKLLWGNETHLTLKYFIKRPDIRVSKLIKMAEILDCNIGDFFQYSDGGASAAMLDSNEKLLEKYPLEVLKTENSALKMIIQEKDARIFDLKKINEQIGKSLEVLLQLGQNSDIQK